MRPDQSCIIALYRGGGGKGLNEAYEKDESPFYDFLHCLLGISTGYDAVVST